MALSIKHPAHMPSIAVEQAFQIATARFRVGQFGAAEAMYRGILEAEPAHAQA